MLSTEMTINERVEQVKTTAVLACNEMVKHLKEIGVETIQEISFSEAEFSLNKDTFTNDYALSGKWFGQNKRLCGSIVFNSDGTFFAEYDVIENHPSNNNWFIEAITSWGRDDDIKVEPRLIQRL